MAKVEHVEDEKSKREKELVTLKKSKTKDEEEIQTKKAEIESLRQQRTRRYARRTVSNRPETA